MEINSDCYIPGFLHDYRIVRQYPKGVLERCRRCRDTHYFRNDTPNREYLSYHMRAILQTNHPRFNKEYNTHGQYK